MRQGPLQKLTSIDSCSFIPFNPTAYDPRSDVLTLCTDLSHSVRINIRQETLTVFHIFWTGWAMEYYWGLPVHRRRGEPEYVGKSMDDGFVAFDSNHVAPAYFDSTVPGRHTIRSPFGEYTVTFHLSEPVEERDDLPCGHGRQPIIRERCCTIRVEEVKFRPGSYSGV